MYFHKIHHPANFRFATSYARSRLRAGTEAFRVRLDDLGASVFRLRVEHPRWPRPFSRAALAAEVQDDHDAKSPKRSWSAGFRRDGALELRDDAGRVFLRTRNGGGFGVSGPAWLLHLQHEPDMQFYGMGEKAPGLELSRRRTKFWNADVWADFDFNRVLNASADPQYLSIPWLIIKRGNTYAGLLIDNPFPVFMATAPDLRIVPHLDRENRPIVDFYVGAPDGRPDIYLIAGPSLDELTRKLQRLCGVTPRPPLWALGHHQSRWGYRGAADLEELDRSFRRHGIPCDGLWLDIDYMRGYRVFTLDRTHLPRPARQLAALNRRGRRVIPIIDPGVKVDPAYAVYRDGLRRGVFCLNPAGTPFTGFVWPGATVFPDFATPAARAWWTERIRQFIAQGFSGAWIDMNDPSTGPSDSSAMLFNRGRDAHATYHNQYANGMAAATHDGLEAARPGRRPFILTRSGYIGINRHAAVWTGDNFSNENHLRACIPMSLNLALSGVPFNGPDVPGFGGDATPALAAAWYKACFLFPFLRNHSAIGTRPQEPWAFGAATTRVIGHFIRLRYKLLPYLYNLFIQHERTGAALLRPLFHDFPDSPQLPLGAIDDQFLAGPALLQAPFLATAVASRAVVLPPCRWFDAASGRWLAGGRRIVARNAAASTPLFVRDGSLIPMQRGEPRDTEKDLHAIEVHLFLSPSFRGEAVLDYTADDGDTLDYRRGAETRVRITATRRRKAIAIACASSGRGAGPLRVRFVVYTASTLVLQGTGPLALTPHRWRFAGAPLRCRVSEAVTIA